jgi:hypothetical protein
MPLRPYAYRISSITVAPVAVSWPDAAFARMVTGESPVTALGLTEATSNASGSSGVPGCWVSNASGVDQAGGMP